MDKDIEKIFGKTKLVRLSKEKKSSIRAGILKFMEANPLPMPMQKIPFWRAKLAYISTAAFALVLVAGGIVSVEAQSSLPGEPPYAVKVGVNEKVLQVLAFSDQEKVNLNMKLAQVRLQEAEKLAIEGKMTENTQKEINKNFNDKANQVTETLKNLDSQKNYGAASKIASDFEASLKAHNKILEKISNPSLGPLITDVSGAAERAMAYGSYRDEAQKQIAENRLQLAEEGAGQLKNLIENQNGQTLPDILYQAQDNLNIALQKIDEGKKKMEGEEKDYRQATILFQQAFTIIKQSQNLIKARSMLRMDF